jgi:hypothetical protein
VVYQAVAPEPGSARLLPMTLAEAAETQIPRSSHSATWWSTAAPALPQSGVPHQGTNELGRWLSAVSVFTLGRMPRVDRALQLPVGAGRVTSTMSLRREENAEAGSAIEIKASDTTILAVQITQNG